MKGRMLKLLADWFIPPRFMRFARQIIFKRSPHLTVRESSILSRNAKFRNMHAGKRCFVIGNGPSLNKQDLTPLADEVTIAMNFFNRHPIIEKWQPTFFCMAEPAENIKRLGLSQFLDKIKAQAYFFRLDVKEVVDKDRLLDPENIYYLKMTGGLLYDWPTHRPLDLTKVIPGARQTAHMAIMIALYLGCSPIYLLGLDQSGPGHFYDEGAEVGNVETSPLGSQIDAIEGTLRSLRDFETLRRIATRNSRVILNTTAGGFLEVFERANYEDILKSKR